MRWRHRLCASIAVLGSGLGGCGSGLRMAPVGGHPANAAPPVVVDSPPPSAKIEKVPADPGHGCAWLDGYWEWTSDTWVWTPGAWVLAEEGCHFALPEAVWVPSAGRGLLFYLSGQWYRDRDGAKCRAPRVCRAAAVEGLQNP
jgi:hypothetical protein